MIKAILYDLDGVLVDAVDIHKAAFAAALKDVAGVVLTEEEHIRDFNGLPTKRKLEILIGQGRINPESVPFIERLKQEMTVAQINSYMYLSHSKIQLHKWAKESGIKLACVTNSIRETASLMLERTGQFRYMDILISNQDVSKAKPSPEGYLKAMDLLGVSPQETLIVEDSPKGVAAARACCPNVMIVYNPNEVNLETVRRCIFAYCTDPVGPATLP